MSYLFLDVATDIADVDITWLKVTGNTGLVVCGKFDSGTGTVTIKRRYPDGSVAAVKDGDGVDYAYAQAFDEIFQFREGDTVGVGVSDASSLSAKVLITGRFTVER